MELTLSIKIIVCSFTHLLIEVPIKQGDKRGPKFSVCRLRKKREHKNSCPLLPPCSKAIGPTLTQLIKSL